MAVFNRKKKSPILFFFGAFVAVVVVMFVANRESVLVERIRFPFNDGVTVLSTNKNFLVAVCRSNKVWVWDWNNLSDEPGTGFAQSHQAFLLKPDVVVSIRQQDPKALVVSDLAGDKKYREIAIGSDTSKAYLGANGDQAAVVLLEVVDADEGGKTSYRISIVDLDTGRLEPAVRIFGEAAGSRAGDLAISGDGTSVVLFGEKDGGAWLLLANLRQRRVVWEKQVPELKLFFDAAFSADSKVVYARGSDSTLHKIETASGKILDRLLPGKVSKSPLRTQHVETIVVSPDGRFVAASVFGAICAWDCGTGKRIFRQHPDVLVSGLAFSPDSRFLASSDVKQGRTIKIWRVSGR